MSMKQESIDSKISEIDEGWDTKCRCFNCLMKEFKEKTNLFKGLLKEVFEEWLKQNPQMGSSTYYSGINTEIKVFPSKVRRDFNNFKEYYYEVMEERFPNNKKFYTEPDVFLEMMKMFDNFVPPVLNSNQ